MRRIIYPLLIILLAACSGSPPRIHNLDWMPVYTKDLGRGGVYEELNLFVRLEDEDGFEDIIEISIHNDDRGWAWTLTEENWVSWSKDGESWLGANGLSRNRGIPEGEYRLKVTDRSGQNSESLFFYASPGLDTKNLRFPNAVVEEDHILIDGGGRKPLLLWFYDDRGEFVAERYLEPGLYNKEELLKKDEKESAAWFMIYHRDEKGGYGLKSGPFMIQSDSSLPASVSASATSEDS